MRPLLAGFLGALAALLAWSWLTATLAGFHGFYASIGG